VTVAGNCVCYTKFSTVSPFIMQARSQGGGSDEPSL